MTYYIYSPWLARARISRRKKVVRKVKRLLFFVILISALVVMGILSIPSRTVYFSNVVTIAKAHEKKASRDVPRRNIDTQKLTSGLKLKTKTLREVTMYSSTPHQTDSTPCIGKSGEDQCDLWKMGQNICASNAFQVGTVLHVDRLGNCVVKDSMNRRYHNRIDWYAGYNDDCLDGIQAGKNCPTYERALRFGTQHLLVAVYSN